MFEIFLEVETSAVIFMHFISFILAKLMKLLMDGMIHPLILEVLNEDLSLILCLLIGKY